MATVRERPPKPMSYVDKNLMEGEQVVYRTRRHWIVFAKAMVFLALGVVLSIALWLAESESLPSNAKFIPLAAGVLIALITGLPAWIHRLTAEFAVTNKRVIVKVGWIQRRSLETLLTKVEGIEVIQGIAGRIFDYGTIIITGTGGSKEPFATIAAPLQFRRKVQEQIIALQEMR